MTYKRYAGPRVHRRRRRNQLKAGVLAALFIALALSASWVAPREPPVPDQKKAAPPASELAVARNLYAASGDRGFAHEYLVQWPQYGAYIRGEVDSIEACG